MKQEDALLVRSGKVRSSEYPQDKYLPSCLILGYTKEKRPLHIQISCDPTWVITCYNPSEKTGEWSPDFKHRRVIK